MDIKYLLQPILHDESLTRGLGDPEARFLVEWLVDQVESCWQETSLGMGHQEVHGLCRRARSIVRFVCLWCLDHQPGAACQLAATERFAWPLPTGPVEAGDLLQAILTWESQQLTLQRQEHLSLAG